MPKYRELKIVIMDSAIFVRVKRSRPKAHKMHITRYIERHYRPTAASAGRIEALLIQYPDVVSNSPYLRSVYFSVYGALQ